ncbi:MAG TPA: DUF924 family protein [Dokdonella sp.]
MTDATGDASVAAIDPRANCVLGYWFGHADDDASVFAEKGPLWFTPSDAVDAEIGDRFAALRDEAIGCGLDDWLATPRGRLARIILVDQFSRNLFRGDARAFVHDDLARGWVDEGLCLGLEQELRPVERQFFYMPLQHAESIADQQHAVALFTQLRDAVPAALRARFAHCLDYAVRHRDIIARFGRFPHRNAVLGRASTPEEIDFLAQPGSSF